MSDVSHEEIGEKLTLSITTLRRDNTMKNYAIFAISFIVLFLLFQLLSGYILTFFYTPDVSSAWNQTGNLSTKTTLEGTSSFFPLLFAFFAATIAYFVPKFFIK